MAESEAGEVPPEGVETGGRDPDSQAVRRTVLVVGAALFVALVVSMGLGRPRIGRPPRIETFVRPTLFVSTFTVVVLVALLSNYAAISRELPNPFTRSLLLFSVALLRYALSSSPLVWLVLDVRQGLLGLGIGGFAFLPDVFAAVAVTPLLHRSYR